MRAGVHDPSRVGRQVRRPHCTGQGRRPRYLLLLTAIVAAFVFAACRPQTPVGQASRLSGGRVGQASRLSGEGVGQASRLSGEGHASRLSGPVLRACADPNNLPFSNDRLEGFENRIAAMLAKDMNARLEYTWWAQRRGFVRNTLKAGKCDLVLGVPSGFDQVLTTRPYYRSSYMFVTRASDGPHVGSFDDPVLRRVRVGVQLIGNDQANSPPAHALSARHIIDNVRGYTVYGDYRTQNPPAAIVRAVAAGEIDVAVVWGPLAGYFASRESVPLRLAPVSPQVDLPFMPFVFDIAMGVRRDDHALRDRVDAMLDHRRADIDAVLAEFGIPRVDQ